MSNKRKLGIGITCYPTFGGSGVVATEVGMAMARRGHKVHFICYDVPRRLDRYQDNIFFHEVEVHDYPLFVYPPYPLSLASKMVEVASYEKIDLMHVHYAVPHATSAYLAKQLMGDKAPKIVTTLHGTDITLVGNDRSYLPIVRFSIAESDGVTVPSHYLKNATYDKLNLSTTKSIEVIPNFVDTTLYKPRDGGTKERRCHLSDKLTGKERILTHVSNFRPVKRIQDVIAVFDLVNKEIPSHLVLIGDGPERSKAEAQARDLGIHDRISFLGKQENFVSVLQDSCLFLLPSETESFGLAALEAMSCGVPVIASKVHGIPEVVVHGETGYLSDVGDVKDMAKNALTLLNDHAQMSRFSSAARERVVANFDMERLVDKYEDYYLRILG